MSENRVSFGFEGGDELIEKLKEMGRRGTSAANRALRQAAEPILEEAVRNVDSKLRRESGKGVAGLKVGRIVTRGGRKVILIGIDRGDISEVYYMKFHEFGSSHEVARPFLRPALQAKREEAYGILRDELKGVIAP